MKFYALVNSKDKEVTIASIGGGGFMNIRSSQGAYTIVDFRETAPAAAFQDMYNNNTTASLYGGLAM
jgi:gamma-glutamyltranspeptidase/glutathione hydrolase